MDPIDQKILQLEQKVIYFKSEFNKYRRFVETDTIQQMMNYLERENYSLHELLEEMQEQLISQGKQKNEEDQKIQTLQRDVKKLKEEKEEMNQFILEELTTHRYANTDIQTIDKLTDFQSLKGMGVEERIITLIREFEVQKEGNEKLKKELDVQKEENKALINQLEKLKEESVALEEGLTEKIQNNQIDFHVVINDIENKITNKIITKIDGIQHRLTELDEENREQNSIITNELERLAHSFEQMNSLTLKSDNNKSSKNPSQLISRRKYIGKVIPVKSNGKRLDD